MDKTSKLSPTLLRKPKVPKHVGPSHSAKTKPLNSKPAKLWFSDSNPYPRRELNTEILQEDERITERKKEGMLSDTANVEVSKIIDNKGYTGVNLPYEGEERYPRREVDIELLERDDRIAEKIKAGLKELSDGELHTLYNVMVALKDSKQQNKNPETAPELYRQRANRKETAPEFIKRVYGEYMDGDFTQADLKRLDPKCYMALHNWLRSNRLPDDLNLPTISQKNTKLLASTEVSYKETKPISIVTPETAAKARLYKVKVMRESLARHKTPTA